MTTCYDNVLKEENTGLRFTIFKNRECIQKLVGSMPDEQELGQWELHTLEDIRWNDNHQCIIKYWSRDIMKSMRWLMRHPTTLRITVSPHSVALTAIRLQNGFIPKCTLQTGDRRHL